MAKIAIASRYGTDVDEHFGRASFFRIYETEEGGSHFLEARDVVDALQHLAEPCCTNLERVADLIDDCEFVLVNRIGIEAIELLLQRGKRVFEVSGSIDGVLEKLTRDGVFSGEREVSA